MPGRREGVDPFEELRLDRVQRPDAGRTACAAATTPPPADPPEAVAAIAVRLAAAVPALEAVLAEGSVGLRLGRRIAGI